MLRIRWRAAVIGATAIVAQAVSASPAQPGAAALTYRAALDLALSRNLELAAARLGRPVREARVRAAGQVPNPDVTFEANRDTPHQALTFGIPIEIGGTRGHRLAVARAELSLADLEERTVVRQIRRAVRLAFYGLVAADQRVDLANDLVGVARRVREAAEARFEAGAAPRVEVLAAELGLGRAQADAELARAGRVTAQSDLNLLLDQAPGEPAAVTGDLADVPPTPTFDRAMAIAEASNLDLAGAEREAAIEQERASLLRAERVPMPVFSVGALFNSPGEFDVGAHAGVNVAVPLFSRNQGEIAESLATVQQIRARQQAARKAVGAQVFASLARIEAQRQQLDAYRTTLVPSATALQQLAEESYRLGRTSVLGVFEAQRALRDVQRDYLQVLVELQSAVADLEEIVGAPIE